MKLKNNINNNKKKKIKFPTVRGSIHIPGQTPVVQTVANSKEKGEEETLEITMVTKTQPRYTYNKTTECDFFFNCF